MKEHKIRIDQMGRKIEIPKNPQRIISLVPSQTELLAYFGLEEKIVGITKFCIHPEKIFQEKTKIGGTKNYHFDRIEKLNPDLIIGNKEENEKIQIEKLEEKYPVWMSDIETLEEAFEMILMLGEIFDKKEKAQELVEKIKTGFSKINLKKKKSVAYLIWQKPFMAAGKGTFINDLMQRIGLENIFADEKKPSRYPEIGLKILQEKKPELILLSSEPYPFKTKHLQEIQKQIPESKVILADGEMFSWYGSRLLKAIDYFSNLKI